MDNSGYQQHSKNRYYPPNRTPRGCPPCKQLICKPCPYMRGQSGPPPPSHRPRPTFEPKRRKDTMERLLQSIAGEEMALARLVDQEARKVERSAKCIVGPCTPDEAVAVQKSVGEVLDRVVRKEELLLRKLRIVLAMYPPEKECGDAEI